MKQYLLSIYQPEGDTPPPEVLAPVMRRLAALNEEIKAAGAWVFAGGLHEPSTATVVRAGERGAGEGGTSEGGGGVVMTDGPYIEGKEYLGGFTILKATDLDSALAWAGRLAEIVRPLAIEVRPFAHAAD